MARWLCGPVALWPSAPLAAHEDRLPTGQHYVIDDRRNSCLKAYKLADGYTFVLIGPYKALTRWREAMANKVAALGCKGKVSVVAGS